MNVEKIEGRGLWPVACGGERGGSVLAKERGLLGGG